MYAPFGRIRKNHLVDKKTHGDWVPMSRHTRATVLRAFARAGLKLGEHKFLFYGPLRAGPWTRQHVRDMMKRAEEAARIDHIGGEHAWRRKWFSERKDYPVADLMQAGGHADPKTVPIYQQADPETTYNVVARPTRRIRRDKPV
ncbi:MAG TPA: tyrosine-type recombinase/integrase [Longimicrobiaceae bacterium]|nr:tyrosine-type recombinase/integrase [Longimicrobiaceae bacterium]